MLNVLLVGATLLTAAPGLQDQPGPVPSDLAAYREAQASVGRDPDAHVRLALWCEAHGLPAERMKHLAIAVVSNPRHSLARGLLGLVEYRGRWQRPETISEKAKNDALLSEYRDRRAKTKEESDALWSLALWCDENGLKDEAAAHFTAVIKLDPKRDSAWRRLGFKKQGGRWVTDAQLAEAKAEADRQKEADRYWKPLLEKWRNGLRGKNLKRRAEAETALSEISDPRAVRMIWQVFAAGGVEQQTTAVQVLGRLDSTAASQALVLLAAFSGSSEVCRTAAETLKRRDPREYAGLLIGMLRTPIKYQVKPVGGPGSPGVLHVEGTNRNYQRHYTPPSMPRLLLPIDLSNLDLLTYDFDGLPVIVRGRGVAGMIAPTADGQYITIGGITTHGAPQTPPDLVPKLIENPAQAVSTLSAHAQANTSPPKLDALTWSRLLAWQGLAPTSPGRPSSTILIGQAVRETEKAAASLQQQLEADLAAVESSNSEIRGMNDRLSGVLNETTGADLPADADVWQAWWLDQLGYAQKRPYEHDKPTFVEVVTQPLPPVAGFEDNSNGYVRRMSCFGAGTLVHTLSGVQTIESLHEGDRVLAQNMKTGALGYKPILLVHRNPPSPTYRIALGDETVVSSHFHRFWKPGKGWVMARDLAAGDTVRTLGGLVQVRSIDPDEVQPVFNLDVAEDADFFVGRQGALVHDNTLPELRQTPFDSPPSLAAARP